VRAIAPGDATSLRATTSIGRSTRRRERSAGRDLTPGCWFADSDFYGWQRSDGWPNINDAALEAASDAELARYLNLLGWPVVPVAPAPAIRLRGELAQLGMWTGGTHWP
jgi:hypothetical protein